jgi:hypothetical protein
LYKLAQGYNLLVCNEFLFVGESIMYLVIQAIVVAINVMFRKIISWPIGDKMEIVIHGFKALQFV